MLRGLNHEILMEQWRQMREGVVERGDYLQELNEELNARRAKSYRHDAQEDALTAKILVVVMMLALAMLAGFIAVVSLPFVPRGEIMFVAIGFGIVAGFLAWHYIEQKIDHYIDCEIDLLFDIVTSAKT